MRAIVQGAFGSADVLRLAETHKPAIGRARSSWRCVPLGWIGAPGISSRASHT
jgi:hypothetical protein